MSNKKLSHRRPFGNLVHDREAFDREFQRMGEERETMRAYVAAKLSSPSSTPEQFEARQAHVLSARGSLFDSDRRVNISYHTPGIPGHGISNHWSRPPLNKLCQYTDESDPQLTEANRLRRELYDAMLDYEFKRGLLVAPHDRWGDLLEHEKVEQHKEELQKAVEANNTFEASNLAKRLRDYEEAKKKYEQAKQAVIDFEKGL